MKQCKAIGCSTNIPSMDEQDFCLACRATPADNFATTLGATGSMAELYPQYYKDFSDVDEADVYLVHDRFKLQDHSGALHHASKKILLSGVRTGGKSRYKDIQEARDTLSRWLAINEHSAQEG